MKIIKQGNKIEKEFTCKECGCVFVADITEYQVKYEFNRGKKFAIMDCPNCKNVVKIEIERYTITE